MRPYCLLPQKFGQNSGLLQAASLYQYEIAKAVSVSRSSLKNIKKKLTLESLRNQEERVLVEGAALLPVGLTGRFAIFVLLIISPEEILETSMGLLCEGYFCGEEGVLKEGGNTKAGKSFHSEGVKLKNES